MPQVSGIAGIIPTQDQGLDLSGLARTMIQMREMKKNEATQNLQTVLQLAQQGLVDPAALEKSVKEWEKHSGIKLSEIQQVQPPTGGGGFGTPSMTPEQGKAMQAVGKAGELPSGAQSATPVSTSSAKAYPAGGVQPPMEGGNIYENYINQIRRQSTAKALSAEKTSNLEATLADLKNKALQGDEGARQQLQAAGELTFNAEFERLKDLRASDPEGYAKEMAAAHDRALGLELPADKEKRRSQFITSLVATGDYTAEQASQEFDKPGSSGIKKTLEQNIKEATLFHNLQESFGDEAAAKLAPQLAAGASLNEVLPNVGKFQSQFAQQLAESKRQHEELLGVEKAKLGIEGERLRFEEAMGAERMQNLSDKIANELDKAENKDFGERFSAIIQAAKTVDIPKEVLDSYIKQMAEKVGLTQTEARSWFGWVAPKYAPAPWSSSSPGGKVLDQLVPGGKGAAPVVPYNGPEIRSAVSPKEQRIEERQRQIRELNR